MPPTCDKLQAAEHENQNAFQNAGTAPLEKLPFELQQGEKIIRELKPQFLGFMLTSLFGKYVGLLCIVVLGFVGVLLFGVTIGESSIVTAIVALLVLLISIKPLIAYGKSWYWITTRRVIGKRGFIGYNIYSIPLENITDLVLTRTLLDRILGISSLMVVPMGGDSYVSNDSPDRKTQNTNFFPALPQNVARELQRVIFNLRDELKKSQITPHAPGADIPGSSEAPQPKSNFPRGTI